MKSLALGLSVAVLVFSPLSALVDGTTYTFQTVISLGDAAFTQLLGINNSQTIAGYFGDGTIVPNNGFTLVLTSSFAPENFPAGYKSTLDIIHFG